MKQSYSETVLQIIPKSKRDRLLRHYKDLMASSTESLNEFAAKLTTDPVYSMRWADNTFMYAARFSVAKEIVFYLEHFQNGGDIRNALLNKVLSASKYVYNKSTSHSANHMQECELAVHAEELERFEGVVDLDATTI